MEIFESFLFQNFDFTTMKRLFLNIYRSKGKSHDYLSDNDPGKVKMASQGPLLEPITGTLFICTASSCHRSRTMGLLESTAIDDPSFSSVLFPPAECRIFPCATLLIKEEPFGLEGEICLLVSH